MTKNGTQHVFVSAGWPQPKLESAPRCRTHRAKVVMGPPCYPHHIFNLKNMKTSFKGNDIFGNHHSNGVEGKEPLAGLVNKKWLT